jgi:hypothetical protein
MTTITITAADIGMTVAQNGVLSTLRYLVADRGMFQIFRLVDDAAPFHTVPRQLFNSDMLTQETNNNGALQSPYGVCFEDATIAFGNLTIAACPTDAVFSVDCTGALAAPIPAVSAPHDAYVAHLAEQRLNLTALHAERVRTGYNARPPTSLELMAAAAITVTPPPPPPPPDPMLVAVEQEAQTRWGEHREWLAKHGGAVGPSLEQIRTELLVAAQHRRAEEAAAAAANAAADQRAEEIRAARAAAQAEATALLAKTL